jgi:hypothetical protein
MNRDLICSPSIVSWLTRWTRLALIIDSQVNRVKRRLMSAGGGEATPVVRLVASLCLETPQGDTPR